MAIFQWVATGVVLASVAACGGGSGGDSASSSTGASTTTTAGGSSSNVLKLSSSNYTSVTQESLSSSKAVSNPASLSSSLVTGAEVDNQALALEFARAQLPQLQDWLQTAPQLVTGAVQSRTLGCAGGGTMTVAVNDANGNQALDVGDSVSIATTNCVYGSSAINGNMSIVVNSLAGSTSTDVYHMGLAMVLNNLAAVSPAGTGTVNGSMNVDIQSTAYHTSKETVTTGSSLTLSGTYGGTSYSRTMTGYASTVTTSPLGSGYTMSTTVSGTLASSNFGSQSVAISTVAPWVQTNLQTYPASGQVLLTGADGSRVRVTAQPADQVLIELDADGNGTYEASTTKAWSSLL